MYNDEPLYYIHWREKRTGKEGRTRTPCPLSAAQQAVKDFQSLNPHGMELSIETAEPAVEFIVRKQKIEFPMYQYA